MRTAAITGTALAAILALAGCGGNDDTAGAQEADTEQAEVAEEAAPRYEVTEDGRDLIVEFDVPYGGGSASAQDAGWDAFTWAVDEHPDHDGRFVLRSFREDDPDSMTVNAFYEPETVEAIDFDSFNKFELWEVRDSGLVNPSYLD